MYTIKDYFKDPKFRFIINGNIFLHGSDEIYLKKMYKLWTGKDLNLENPSNYNEKIQWLKLYNRKDEYTEMADKYAVKDYVARKIGEGHTVPTLGVWDKFSDIDFSKLPNQFVLKCTHDSQSAVFCTDKETFDFDTAKKKLTHCLKINYYNFAKEHQYKFIKPRIIAEPLIKSDNGNDRINDYKVFCFNGIPKYLDISQGMRDNRTINIFDMDFNQVDSPFIAPTAAVTPSKPECFDEMIEYATILSKDIPHVRVDFYIIDGKPFVGALTLTPNAGFEKFRTDEWNETMGSWITLPKEKIYENIFHWSAPKRYIKNKWFRFIVHRSLGFYCGMSDEAYLKKSFKILMNKDLNLDEPKTFNEKLQWLKLYGRKDEYTEMTDKYAMKDYVTRKIGEGHTIPILGVWNKFSDIDFSQLPNQFVLKCTHDSQSRIFCTDKNTFDFKAAKKKLTKCLRINYYYFEREYVYKNIKPKIIAEPLLSDGVSTNRLTDYKFFCFNGVPKILCISKFTPEGAVADFFDMDFNHIDDPFQVHNDPITPKKPTCFDQMKKEASLFSKDIPQLRVDFYIIDGKPLIGEFTFFSCAGYESFKSDEWNETMGSWIKLPPKK